MFPTALVLLSAVGVTERKVAVKAVVLVLVLGCLASCFFFAMVSGGDVDAFKEAGTTAPGAVIKDITSSTENNTGMTSTGVIGETGRFFCEKVQGGRWVPSISACYTGD